MKYDQTQLGWFIIATLLLSLIMITLAYFFQWGNNPITLNLYLILSSSFLLFSLLFYKLRVIVDDTGASLIYGIGLISIKIQPQKIYTVEAIKVPWYYGIGLRITPTGMLYNIHGFNAVKLTYSDPNGNKKSAIIGAKNPEKLIEVLKANYVLRQ